MAPLARPSALGTPPRSKMRITLEYARDMLWLRRACQWFNVAHVPPCLPGEAGPVYVKRPPAVCGLCCPPPVCSAGKGDSGCGARPTRGGVPAGGWILAKIAELRRDGLWRRGQCAQKNYRRSEEKDPAHVRPLRTPHGVQTYLNSDRSDSRSGSGPDVAVAATKKSQAYSHGRSITVCVCGCVYASAAGTGAFVSSPIIWSRQLLCRPFEAAPRSFSYAHQMRA